MRHNHNGVAGVDAAIFIGFFLLSIGGGFAMFYGLSASIAPDLHIIVTNMPTIYQYDPDTGKRVETKETPEQKESRSVFNQKQQQDEVELNQQLIEKETEYYNALAVNDIERANELEKEIEQINNE